MSNLEKDKQTLEELNRTQSDTLKLNNNTVNQEMIAQAQQTPQTQLTQHAIQLQAAIRLQQLKTEQAIQQTLQQAHTALQDAQKIETLTMQVQTLQQALSQQGSANNPHFFGQILRQLSKSVNEQLHQADQQIAQSLQQAVVSISQSQAAMLDSQTYSTMAEMLKQCEQTVMSLQNQSGQTVH